MAVCELCSSVHNQTYGSGRFCSSKCAKSFSTRNNRHEINLKVSHALKREKRVKISKCKQCKNDIEYLGRKPIICSQECRAILRSIAAKKGCATSKANGVYRGWQTRTKEPSYPERYFISLFENENISGYTREYKQYKYFIDFAFIEQKLAIEVDGKQHEQPERKLKDQEKDLFLAQNGWTVVRIKWRNPTNAENAEFLHSQINDLKTLLKDFGIIS